MTGARAKKKTKERNIHPVALSGRFEFVSLTPLSLSRRNFSSLAHSPCFSGTRPVSAAMGERSSRGCLWWLVSFAILGLVIAAGVITILHSKNRWKSTALPVPGPPGAVSEKYGEALRIALQFFDIQKSGKLQSNSIPWRGDSALKDGKEAGLDLSKGMYDAGDHVKFGLPMAFTTTMLSWSILEYGDQMNVAKQLTYAQESLKWMTDYLINAHPKDNILYIQVGDPKIDHACWERPEDMAEERPVIQVNTSAPGTEVAAETAAALASASLVFKAANPTYSTLLLQHAKQLFTFADSYRASYSISIPQAQQFYNSTGYNDELLWAAAWLYHATQDNTYLSYVTVENGESFAEWGSPSWFSWDNKLAGTQVLLSRIVFFGSGKAASAENSGLKNYKKTAEAVMCGLLPDSPTATTNRTDGGLIWISQWNSLQHPVASAFLAVLYSDYMLTSRTPRFFCNEKAFSPTDLRKFAASQADYVLGDNPMKLSYLVGYSSNYPLRVHHRGASIPTGANTGCKGWQWLTSMSANPNVAYGALVGGPFQNDSFIDLRNNSMQTEPTTYNSAVIVALLSGLVTTSSVVESFT